MSPRQSLFRTLLLLEALYVCLACESRPPAPVAPPEAADAASRLAREWVTLFDSPTQREADERLQVLRRDWLDRVVTWEVEVIPPFCGTDACNVRAFDFARLPERAAVALGGALPRLSLASGQPAALRLACQGHDPHCVARVRGRITVLPEDADAPLAIEIDGVRVLSARSAGTTERFGRPTRPASRRHVVDPLRSAERS